MSTLGRLVTLVTSKVFLSARHRRGSAIESRMRRLIGAEGVLTLGSSRTVIVERLVVEQSTEVARFGGLESVQVVDCENE
jgi:hypothetical protein